MRTVAIIQARLGSERLPNKVMLDIAGKPMLHRVLERVAKADGIDLIVTATPDREICNAVEVWDIGVAYMAKCAEDDVLSRYYLTAKEFQADVVVRITGDCPLVGPAVISGAANAVKDGALFATNVQDCGFPDGTDVEAMTFGLLSIGNQYVNTTEDREHVTRYMRRWFYDSIRWLESDGDYSHLPKMSVDTQEDLDVVRSIYEGIGKDIFGLDEVSECVTSEGVLR